MLNRLLPLESQAEIELCNRRIDAIWRVLEDGLVHLLSTFNADNAGCWDRVAKNPNPAKVQIRVRDEDLPGNRSFKFRRVRIARNQLLVSVEGRTPSALQQQKIGELQLRFRGQFRARVGSQKALVGKDGGLVVFCGVQILGGLEGTLFITVLRLANDSALLGLANWTRNLRCERACKCQGEKEEWRKDSKKHSGGET